MKEVVEIYIRRLGLGIVNIVNIFDRSLCCWAEEFAAEYLLVPLRRILREECFGGERGDVPEIEEAVLGNNAGIIGAAGLL